LARLDAQEQEMTGLTEFFLLFGPWLTAAGGFGVLSILYHPNDLI
jgi:hypothetical protein